MEYQTFFSAFVEISTVWALTFCINGVFNLYLLVRVTLDVTSWGKDMELVVNTDPLRCLTFYTPTVLLLLLVNMPVISVWVRLALLLCVLLMMAICLALFQKWDPQPRTFDWLMIKVFGHNALTLLFFMVFITTLIAIVPVIEVYQSDASFISEDAIVDIITVTTLVIGILDVTQVIQWTRYIFSPQCALVWILITAGMRADHHPLGNLVIYVYGLFALLFGKLGLTAWEFLDICHKSQNKRKEMDDISAVKISEV